MGDVGALSHGGKLTILDHSGMRQPRMCDEHLVREQVTVLNQTPSAFLQSAAGSLRPREFGAAASAPVVFAAGPEV